MLSQVYWSRAHSTEMAKLPAEPPKAPFAFSVHFSADRGLEGYNQVNKEEDTSFITRATLARPLSTVAAKNSGTAYLPTIPKKSVRAIRILLQGSVKKAKICGIILHSSAAVMKEV